MQKQVYLGVHIKAFCFSASSHDSLITIIPGASLQTFDFFLDGSLGANSTGFWQHRKEGSRRQRSQCVLAYSFKRQHFNNSNSYTHFYSLSIIHGAIPLQHFSDNRKGRMFPPLFFTSFFMWSLGLIAVSRGWFVVILHFEYPTKNSFWSELMLFIAFMLNILKIRFDFLCSDTVFIRKMESKNTAWRNYLSPTELSERKWKKKKFQEKWQEMDGASGSRICMRASKC